MRTLKKFPLFSKNMITPIFAKFINSSLYYHSIYVFLLNLRNFASPYLYRGAGREIYAFRDLLKCRMQLIRWLEGNEFHLASTWITADGSSKTCILCLYAQILDSWRNGSGPPYSEYNSVSKLLIVHSFDWKVWKGIKLSDPACCWNSFNFVWYMIHEVNTGVRYRLGLSGCPPLWTSRATSRVGCGPRAGLYASLA